MKESDKHRAIIAETVARGWREPAFLSEFRQNPKMTLQKAGMDIPATMEVVVLENSPTVINAVLPPKGDMQRYEARMQKAVKMLADLPEDMEVHLHRDSAIRSFIIIPEAPSHGGELSDAQLEQVVGGKGSSPHKDVAVTVNNVATATQGVTLAVAVTGAAAVEEVAAVTTAAGVAEVAGAVVAVVVPCFIS